jgi:hypothetical protein
MDKQSNQRVASYFWSWNNMLVNKGNSDVYVKLFLTLFSNELNLGGAWGLLLYLKKTKRWDKKLCPYNSCPCY